MSVDTWKTMRSSQGCGSVPALTRGLPCAPDSKKETAWSLNRRYAPQSCPPSFDSVFPCPVESISQADKSKFANPQHDPVFLRHAGRAADHHLLAGSFAGRISELVKADKERSPSNPRATPPHVKPSGDLIRLDLAPSAALSGGFRQNNMGQNNLG